MLTNNDFASESGHWYRSDGTPAYSIVGKNGKERPVTLRDARANNLVPSVTTVTKLLACPGLDAWKQQQVLMAALTLPRVGGETEPDFLARVIRDSKETGRKAAERGTLIHGALECAYSEKRFNAEYEIHVSSVIYAITNKYGDQAWCAEKSFAKDGYGGKCDLHSPEVVIDFKTKEFTENNLPKSYDEQIIQLAAYRHGLGFPAAKCANVFVSVTEPGLVHIVEHAGEDLSKGWMMFKCLLDFWYLKTGLKAKEKLCL